MSSRHDDDAVAGIGWICQSFRRAPISQTERRPFVIDAKRFPIEGPPEAIAEGQVVTELPSVTDVPFEVVPSHSSQAVDTIFAGDVLLPHTEGIKRRI